MAGVATVIPITPIKPEFGAPCNGCGFCCEQEPCKLAIEHLDHSREGPCRALEPVESGGYRCGLLENPMKYIAPQMADDPEAVAYGRRELSPKFAFLLGIGAGCDSHR